MRWVAYLEEKIFLILSFLCFLFVLSMGLFVLLISPRAIFLFDVLLMVLFFVLLWLRFRSLKKEHSKMEALIGQCEEKYFLSEVLPKPKHYAEFGYYEAMREACKAMNDRIALMEQERNDYQEYIESFAHEIKTPISVIQLLAENEKREDLNEEVRKIDQLVEQMLYYARSENTEKDYFIKEVLLEDLCHPILVQYRQALLQRNLKIEVFDLDKIVYTDLKWLDFILSQIVQNAIKYAKKEGGVIQFYGREEAHQVALVIQDQGIGIEEADLPRVFEKGFTGSNRKKEYATGMGLYLCKKLCDRLHLSITVESEERTFTRVIIGFPKTNLYHFD